MIKNAFTLVELLIVIVIISVLSGVVIAVINPISQRERAFDGTIIATANKIVSTIVAYNSAKGEYPDCNILVERDLQSASAVDPANNCASTSPEPDRTSGQFIITGITTPKECGADRYVPDGVGADSCGFQYLKNTSDGNVCLGIKLHRATDLNGDGVANTYLFWSSVINRIEDDPNPCCVVTSNPEVDWGEIDEFATERCSP